MINKLNLKYKCCKKQYGEGKGTVYRKLLKGKKYNNVKLKKFTKSKVTGRRVRRKTRS
jgi:hypothetical protein